MAAGAGCHTSSRSRDAREVEVLQGAQEYDTTLRASLRCGSKARRCGRTIQRMIEILRANRAAFVERLAARVAESVPQYSNVDTDEIRRNIDGLASDLLLLVEEGARAN